MAVARHIQRRRDLLPARISPLRRTASTRPFAFSLAWSVCLLLVLSCAAFCQSSPTASEPGLPKDSANPVLAEAKSLLRQGSVNEAESTVRRFLAVQPESAEGHFLLGHILFREIQTDAVAGSQLEGVTASQTNSMDGQLIAEKARASLAEFTTGAKYHVPGAADLKIVSLDYVLLGAYADADKWLTKMLEWTPNDAEGWYLLGRTKYNENRFAEAVGAFQQSLKLDPQNVKAEDNLGLSYAGLGRNEEATAAYQQAMAWQEEAPLKNPGPYLDLGTLLIDLNRSGESVSYLLKAAEIASRSSRAHELLGKAYTRLEEFPKAQAELERAIELAPQSANLHCMLAPVYRKQGLAEKAKSEFDRCAAMASSHSIPETPRD
jgi:tetratricopeptide (TPR) repeat protein